MSQLKLEILFKRCDTQGKGKVLFFIHIIVIQHLLKAQLNFDEKFYLMLWPNSANTLT